MQTSVICATDLRMSADAPMQLPADMIQFGMEACTDKLPINVFFIYVSFKLSLASNNGDRSVLVTTTMC